jgi:hypothetical protein
MAKKDDETAKERQDREEQEARERDDAARKQREAEYDQQRAVKNNPMGGPIDPGVRAPHQPIPDSVRNEQDARNMSGALKDHEVRLANIEGMNLRDVIMQLQQRVSELENALKSAWERVAAPKTR